MQPWQTLLHKHPCSTLNFLFRTTTSSSHHERIIENESQETIASKIPGFLESSEEFVSMQPFKDHPRGLAEYKKR